MGPTGSNQRLVVGELAASPGRVSARLTATLAVLGAVLSLLPAAAHATFPGANGRIAYQHSGRCLVPSPFPPDVTDVFTIQPDGSGETNLTNNVCTTDGRNTVLGEPSYAPSGREITLIRDGLVSVMNADGSGLRGITNGEGATQGAGGPAFSADGAKVGFSVADIFTVDAADGRNLTQLTNNPTGNYDTSFSPDGTKVAFMSLETGIAQIFTMNVNGTNKRQLTSVLGLPLVTPRNFSPDYSPDGTKIVFASDRDDDGEIYVMNADGSDQRRITNVPGSDSSPVFSPDGMKVAFVSSRRAFPSGGSPELFVMNADGSDQTLLTTAAARGTAGDTGPTWQPLPVPRTLTVTKAGDGQGAVTSLPAGIDCGSVCSRGFDTGTEVKLTASPAADSAFSGFSGGGCSGTTASCTVTLDAARSVTATFTAVPPPPATTPATTGTTPATTGTTPATTGATPAMTGTTPAVTGTGTAAAPSPALTPSITPVTNTGTRPADRTPARLTVTGFPRSISRSALRRGLRFRVSANEPVSLAVRLLARPKRVAAAAPARFDLILARKFLPRASGIRSVTLTPARAVTGRRPVRLRVQIVGVDRGGNRTRQTLSLLVR